jgi:H2-forming N5,N10-methylenetetrahydromethanopterin dehydrogenase-like enzyme
MNWHYIFLFWASVALLLTFGFATVVSADDVLESIKVKATLCATVTFLLTVLFTSLFIGGI